MAHDVFISYSQHDKPTADAACAALEMAGSRCWIAPRDVPPGATARILDGIGKSRVMVLIFLRTQSTQKMFSAKSHAFRNYSPSFPSASRISNQKATWRISSVRPIGSTRCLRPSDAHLGRLCQTVKSLLPTLDEAAGVRPAAGRGSPAVGIEKGVGPTDSHSAFGRSPHRD